MGFSFTGSWVHDLDRWLTTDPRSEEEPILECSECEEGIFEGEDYYQIGDECYCEECIAKFKKVAERTDEGFGEE